MMRREIMKRILATSSLLFLLFPLAVSAQTPSEITVPPATPSAVIVPTVDYTLPYPGLLPDNPLYGLKTMRDRIVGFLISDPLKKSSFDLLQADKRLQAGVYLVQTEGKGKETLAEQTISKGENYLSEAVSKLQEAKMQGRDVTDSVNTLVRASQKHQLVIMDLEKNVSQQEVRPFQLLIQRVTSIGRDASKLLKK